MKKLVKKVSEVIRSKTAQAVSGVKQATKKAAKKIADFVSYTQAYRVWRKLDSGSYTGQGHGTVCNLRGLLLRQVATGQYGQYTVLHRGTHGYGYSWGKLIEKGKDGSITIQCGTIQIKFVASQIVASFEKFSGLVAYVQKHGEKNIAGVEQYRALSNGARYALYTNGKSVLRFESAGSASGNYHDYQKSGKLYAKFADRQAAKK